MAAWASLLGLLGIVLLGVPALHLDRYARRVVRLRSLRSAVADAELARRRQALVAELVDLRDGWSRWKRYCLYCGIALAASGQLLALLNALGH